MARAKPQTEASEVQAPQERGVWQFETVELLQIIAQPVAIVKDKRGKKLGVINLPSEMFYEPEDVIDWLNNLIEKLQDPEHLETLRGNLLAQRAQQNGQAPT